MKNKIKFIIFFVFNWSMVIAQPKMTQNMNDMYGKWKCVRLGVKGLQKFNFEQAKQLEASILTIDSNKYYFGDDITFVSPCSFPYWEISMYDTLNEWGNVLSYLYYKKDLAKLYVLKPVFDNRNSNCFNECGNFYLKGDTLINICGGYQLYMLKETKTCH